MSWSGARWRGGRVATLVAVALAMFADLLVYSMVVPILPVYASSLGASPAQIGLLFAAYAIGLIPATILFGWAADRRGRRRSMLLGAAGLVMTTIMFTVATTYPVLVLARFLQGVAAAGTWTASLALLAEVLPPPRRGRGMSVVLVSMTAGSLVGPPLGGFLFDLGGIHMPFLAVIGLTLLTLVALAVLLVEPPRHKAAWLPLAALLRDRALLRLALVVAVGGGSLSLLEPVLPLHLARTMHATSGAIGLLFAAAVLVYGIASPPFGVLADRSRPQRLMGVGLVATAVTLPVLAFPRSLPVEGAALMAFALAYGLTLAPALPGFAAVVDRYGGGSYGTAYAVFNLAYAAGMTAGPIAGGALATVLAIPATLGLAAAVTLLVGAELLVRTPD